MIRPPPRSTPFPYTPLSRSLDRPGHDCGPRPGLPMTSAAGGAEDGAAAAKLTLKSMGRQISPAILQDVRSLYAPLLRNADSRSEEHTSELQSHLNLVCRLLL